MKIDRKIHGQMRSGFSLEVESNHYFPAVKISIILSIFNFSTCFLVQIVENRRGRLSRPFLGHGDNFSKSSDENQTRSKRTRAAAARGIS